MSPVTTIPSRPHTELEEDLRSGSRDRFRKFYGKYAPMVLGIISRTEPDKKAAEHLLQMVFIEIWNSRHTVGSQPAFTWVLQIVRKITQLHDKTGNNSQNQNTSSIVHISNIKDPDAVSKREKQILDDIYINGHNINEAAEKWQIEADELKVILRNTVKTFKTPPHD